MKKIFLLPSIAAAIFILSSCGSNTQPKQDDHEAQEKEAAEGLVFLGKQQREAINLQLGPIENRNLTSVIKTNGQLEVSPENKADITSYIGGNIKEIKVFHGDRVAKGQVLATLEHPDYIALQEEFAQTASRMEFLKKEYERQKVLFEKEVGAGKDFQQVKAEYSSIKSKYNGLKVRLEMMNINTAEVESGKIFKTIAVKSPISGFVNQVNVKVGSYISSETKMFSVSDNSTIHADFLVYEKDIHLIKVGQKVNFSIANRTGKEYTATIFAIGKEFQDDTRAVLVHARINGAPSGLTSGLYISGSIQTDLISTKALPEEAIVTEGTKSYIFIYDEKASKLTEIDEHAHEAEKAASAKKDNNEEKHEEDRWAFRMVEVVTGATDGKYVEIRLIKDLPQRTKVVLNAAYYLLADSKKKETKHEH